MKVPAKPPVLQYQLKLFCLGFLEEAFNQLKDSEKNVLVKSFKEDIYDERNPILHTIDLVPNSNPVKYTYPFKLEDVESYHWHWVDFRLTYDYPYEVAAVGKTKEGAWFFMSIRMCGVSGFSCGSGTVKIFLADNWRNMWLYGLDDKMRERFLDPIENAKLKGYVVKYMS